MNYMDDPAAHTVLADPIAYAYRLSRLREAVLTGDPGADEPRDLIRQSWLRSLSAHVDPESEEPPVVLDAADVTQRRMRHPLAKCMPMLRQTLLSVAEEAMHMMIVTDAHGHILWREGQPHVQRLADDVGLSPGTCWTESAIGTNAMGTTLAVDRPVQVYSAEHLVRTYQDWTCAAAPVHDPRNGAVIGAIDVSGPLRTVHPATVALVSAAARLAESQLRHHMQQQDEQLCRRNARWMQKLRGENGALLSPDGRVVAVDSTTPLPAHVDVTTDHVVLADGQVAQLESLSAGYLLRLGASSRSATKAPPLALEFLGEGPALVSVGGVRMSPALRHAELLAVLAMHPDGLNADQLATHLYGDSGNPVTVRAEIHRLRAELGRNVVEGKPYRLVAEPAADFLTVRQALLDGEVATAAAHYRGPLLPHSEAPAVCRLRQEQIAGLRRAVLDTDSAEPLWRFAQHDPGREDVEVMATLRQRLASDDPRRWHVGARFDAVSSDDDW